MRSRKNHRWLLLLPFLALMILAPESHAANPSVPANYQEYTQLDIGDILSDGTKAPIQEMLNSKIFVKGKVLKSPQLKDDEIVIYRMIITCCAADALPSGILVKLPEKNQFHDEDWIGVEGTIQLLPFNDNIKSIEPIADMAPQGNAYPYFTATKAYKISVPSSEYLYY